MIEGLAISFMKYFQFIFPNTYVVLVLWQGPLLNWITLKRENTEKKVFRDQPIRARENVFMEPLISAIWAKRGPFAYSGFTYDFEN